jgi:hypothetical protein
MYAGGGAGTVGESYGKTSHVSNPSITYITGFTCNKCLTHSILILLYGRAVDHCV